MISKRDKEAWALKCAEDVFTRYGFARTTMGDIAAAAGISRPALYLLFPDKEAIIARTIEEMDRRSLGEIEADLNGLPSLHAKLLHACTSWGMHGVELAARHPDAADLFDLRFSAVRQAFEHFQALLVKVLGETVTKSGLGVTTDEFARSIVYGMRGLRETASDVEDMRRLIGVQVDIYVSALRQP